MSAPQCSGCKGRIRWIKTVAGKNAPVDPEYLQEWVLDDKPTSWSARKITLIDAEGRTETGWQASVVTLGARMIEGFIPHFSSCSKAAQFRR